MLPGATQYAEGFWFSASKGFRQKIGKKQGHFMWKRERWIGFEVLGMFPAYILDRMQYFPFNFRVA